MIMDVVPRLGDFFSEELSDLRCGTDTRAYIVGVFSNAPACDMSDESVVLAFSDARIKSDFVAYQRIGDWVLCTETFWPNRTNEPIETIGRLSYHACHRLMAKWPLYEELADELPYIVRRVRLTFERRGLVIEPHK